MQPLVSVIIPVYNVAPYLRESLDSVLEQTYENLEILVIDDGSTDGSGDICDEYAQRDARVRVVRQDNRGLSAARNTGLDRMHGALVAFLDSDDAFASEAIGTMVAAQRKSGAEIVVCSYTDHRTAKALRGGKRRAWSGLSIKKEELLSSDEALRRLVDGALGISVWNKLYAGRLWKTIRFPDGCVFEDVHVTPSVLEAAEGVQTLRASLVLRRLRPGSISATHSPENIRNRLYAKDCLDDFILSHIPGVFTTAQLNRVREQTLREGLISFSKALSHAGPEDAAALEALRADLLRRGAALPQEGRSMKTRVLFALFRSCPRSIALIHPAYQFLKCSVLRR